MTLKRVSVLDGCKLVSTGETDGELVDKHYTRVDGELYFYDALIREEDTSVVLRLLREQETIIKAAQDRQFQIRTVFNDTLRNGVCSTNYPGIRKQQWFKDINPVL